jgi:tetratricopeptide (TPR) repeat protein
LNEAKTPSPYRLRGLIRHALLSKTAIGVYGLGALALGALGVVLSPVSPLGMATGDVLLGLDRADLAVVVYDAVAAQNPDPSLRADALRRSASVWSVHLGARAEARKRLFALARADVEVAEIAAIHAEIGALFDDQHKPRQAARHYLKAHEIDANGDVAAVRLARAAEILQREGLDKKALQAWATLAASHPNYRARANVGRAQIRLAQGDEQRALGLFENADSSRDDDVTAIARLGAATCLERLGNLDEALAALDEADLPEDVLETRAGEISDRADRWERARFEWTE